MNAVRGWEWLILLLIVLLLFGSKKLPELARGLGRSLRILKEESAAKDAGVEAAGSQASKASGLVAGEPAAAAVATSASTGSPHHSNQSLADTERDGRRG